MTVISDLSIASQASFIAREAGALLRDYYRPNPIGLFCRRHGRSPQLAYIGRRGLP